MSRQICRVGVVVEGLKATTFSFFFFFSLSVSLMGSTHCKSGIEKNIGYWKSASKKRADTKEREEGSSAAPEFHLLLLGTGEAGKSTLAAHFKGTSEEERFHDPLIAQVIAAATVLLQSNSHVLGALGHSLDAIEREIGEGEERNMCWRKTVERLSTETCCFFDPCCQLDLRRFLDESSALSRLSLLREGGKILAPEWQCSREDRLLVRFRTTGIMETVFSPASSPHPVLKGIAEKHGLPESAVFKVFDVGGPRSERRKWMHCFGSSEVMFLASAVDCLSVLLADLSVRRADESRQLLVDVTGSKVFSQRSKGLMIQLLVGFIRAAPRSCSCASR